MLFGLFCFLPELFISPCVLLFILFFHRVYEGPTTFTLMLFFSCILPILFPFSPPGFLITPLFYASPPPNSVIFFLNLLSFALLHSATFLGKTRGMHGHLGCHLIHIQLLQKIYSGQYNLSTSIEVKTTQFMENKCAVTLIVIL